MGIVRNTSLVKMIRLILLGLLAVLSQQAKAQEKSWWEKTFGKDTCPLQVKKSPSCINLQPPKDIAEALESCWNDAIQLEFQCNSKTDAMKQWVDTEFNGSSEESEESSEESSGWRSWVKKG